jgi:hypothetical protein
MNNQLRTILLSFIFLNSIYISGFAPFNNTLDKDELDIAKKELSQRLISVEENFIKDEDPDLQGFKKLEGLNFSIKPNNLTKRIQNASTFDELNRIRKSVETTETIFNIFKKLDTRLKAMPFSINKKNRIVRNIVQRFDAMHITAKWLEIPEFSEDDFSSTLHDMCAILNESGIEVHSLIDLSSPK